MTSERRCESVRYRSQSSCSGNPDFDVVYRSSGRESDRHPACFTHGLAEVDRHHAAAGIADCTLEPVGDMS